MTLRIDLNSDIGELKGDQGRALDEEILCVVSSCNIACGGHAGDAETMRYTLRAAKKQNVLAGAHPSYPDRQNFGRQSMEITLDDLRSSLTSQIEMLITIAEDEGVTITHLKAHGALYNDAANAPELASLVCECAKDFNIRHVFFLPESCGAEAARNLGLKSINEGFVDRLYEDNGRLTSRSLPKAVHSEASLVIDQAIQLATGKPVTTRQGTELVLPVDTLCLHGDTSGAAEMASGIRKSLENHGVEVRGYV